MEITLRSETLEDQAEIFELTRAAFEPMPYSGGNEPQIIDNLRSEGALTISLVATRVDEIVGHIAFSPVSSSTQSEYWYALGPVSVHPTFQGQGIGKKLILEGLAQLKDRGATACILVGYPEYYSRFGFHLAPNLAPSSQPKDYFMLKSFAENFEQDQQLDFHPVFYK